MVVTFKIPFGKTEIIGVFGSYEDISDRKLLQQQTETAVITMAVSQKMIAELSN